MTDSELLATATAVSERLAALVSAGHAGTTDANECRDALAALKAAWRGESPPRQICRNTLAGSLEAEYNLSATEGGARI